MSEEKKRWAGRRSDLAGRRSTVRRLCPMCTYAWESRTWYRKGDETVCPKCGAPVPGDSLDRGG